MNVSYQAHNKDSTMIARPQVHVIGNRKSNKKEEIRSKTGLLKQRLENKNTAYICIFSFYFYILKIRFVKKKDTTYYQTQFRLLLGLK